MQPCIVQYSAEKVAFLRTCIANRHNSLHQNKLTKSFYSPECELPFDVTEYRSRLHFFTDPSEQTLGFEVHVTESGGEIWDLQSCSNALQRHLHYKRSDRSAGVSF